MSFSDFDDIYCICCEWSKTGFPADETVRKNILFRDTAEEELRFHQSNRWWEAAENEIKAEREKILN